LSSKMTRGRLIKHSQPCDHCGSSDAVSYYEKPDGSTDGWCFSCKTLIKDDMNDMTIPQEPKKPYNPRLVGEIDQLSSLGIPERRISKDVCDFYGVKSRYDENGNELERYYPVYRDGKKTGYKKRVLPKDFSRGRVGDTRGPIELFGQHLFRSGRVVIVTAGEEDALAAFEITKYKSKVGRGIAAVSLPNGCNATALKDNLQWFQNFEKVIFALDQEEEKDLTDAEAFCQLFPPGKAFIARFSENDVSDMCRQGKFTEFYDALFQAKEYTPAGIIRAEDTWDAWSKRDEYDAIPFPPEWGLSRYGDILRLGSLITIGAGTGQGKTTLFKELEYHVFKTTEYNMGIIHLEEPLCDTVGGLMSIHTNTRLNLGDHGLDENQQRKIWGELFQGGRFMLDQAFGHLDANGLADKIRYMAHAGDCKFIFVDHLSALTSMYGTDSGGSKNEKTERLVVTLQMLTQELGICIVLASHVRKRSDAATSYENGSVPDLDSLYGSSSVKNYSDAVLVIQRDQRDPNKPMRYHVIKNRLAGELGPSADLKFNLKNGRIERHSMINTDEGVM
jgi:twinkle protein